MVEIRKFKQADAIDGRVQRGILDTSAAGVIESAYAQVGQYAVDSGNALNKVVKTDEAVDWVSESVTSKAIDADNKQIELLNRFDHATGKIRDVDSNGEFIIGEDGKHQLGDTFVDTFAAWEKEQTQILMGNSPTNMAKSMFLKAENPRMSQRIIGVNSAQYQYVKTHRKDVLYKSIETDKKAMQSYKPALINSPTAIQKGREYIERKGMDINSKSWLGPLEKIDFMDKSSAQIAMGTVEGLITSGDYKNAAISIDMAKLLNSNPELATELDLKEGQKWFTDENGEVKIWTPDESGTSGIVREADGTFESVNPNDDRLKQQGGISPDTFAKHITPEFQLAKAKEILRGLRTTRNANTEVLDRRIKGVMTANMSQDPSVKKRPHTDDEWMDVNNALINDIVTSDISDVKRKKRLDEVISSQLIGKHVDDMVDQSPAQFEAALPDIQNSIRQAYTMANIPQEYVEELIKSQSTINGLRAAYNQQTSRLQNGGLANHVNRNDNRYRNLMKGYNYASVENQGNFMKAVGQAKANAETMHKADIIARDWGKRLGLSPETIRKGLQRNDIMHQRGVEWETLKREGDAKDGGDRYNKLIDSISVGAAEFPNDGDNYNFNDMINSMKADSDISKDLSVVASIYGSSKDPKARAAAQHVLEVSASKEKTSGDWAIMTGKDDSPWKDKELKNEVFDQMKDFHASSNYQNLTVKGASSDSNDYAKLVMDSAKYEMTRTRSNDYAAAVKGAKQKLLLNHISINESASGTVNAIHNTAYIDAGLEPTDRGVKLYQSIAERPNYVNANIDYKATAKGTPIEAQATWEVTGKMNPDPKDVTPEQNVEIMKKVMKKFNHISTPTVIADPQTGDMGIVFQTKDPNGGHVPIVGVGKDGKRFKKSIKEASEFGMSYKPKIAPLEMMELFKDLEHTKPMQSLKKDK